MPFNNAAERALAGLRSGASHACSPGADRGEERAAATYSLIATTKLNDIDPSAWLADVLARTVERSALRLHELLP